MSARLPEPALAAIEMSVGGPATWQEVRALIADLRDARAALKLAIAVLKACGSPDNDPSLVAIRAALPTEWTKP